MVRLVVPDSYRLEDDFRRALLAYVESGGSLLLLGEKCARLFPEALGVSLEGEPAETEAELRSPAGIVSVNGAWQKVSPTTAEVVGFRYPTRDTRSGGEIAATLASYARGKIGVIYGPVTLAYFRSHHPALRAFIGEVAARLFPDPAVKVEAPSCVDIALRRAADGRLSLHLTNLAGAQRADRFLATDHVPGVGPVEVRLRAADKPGRVYWVPDGGEVEWSWADGIVRATIPTLHLHGVLVAE